MNVETRDNGDALCGTTRSQLSPQFHCCYVFCARHSKILSVQVARNYALDANATRFCRKVSTVVSKMATQIPLGIRRGPSTCLPKLFGPLDVDGRGTIEIESDKSSANCIRSRCWTEQVRRLPTDLSLCDEGRIPLEIRSTGDERKLIHQLSGDYIRCTRR